MPARILRLISRESLIVLIGYGTAGAVLLLSLKLLTHFLSPTHFGLFTLALSAQIILVQLIFGPLGASVLRLSPDALARSELRACARATQIWLYRAILCCGALGLLGALLILQVNPAQFWLYFAALIAALSYGASHTGESLLSGTRHRAWSAISSGLGQFLRSSLAILAAYFSPRAEATMLGYMAGSLLAFGLTGVLTRSLIDKLDPPGNLINPISLAREKRCIIDYGKPFLLWAGPTALYLTSDRWLLNYFQNPAEVAVLSAAQLLAQLPVNFLFQFLQLFWAPILFAEQARTEPATGNDPRTLDQLGLLLGAGCLVGTVTLYWVSEPLVRLFANPDYLRAAQIIPLVFLGASLLQLGQWYALDQLGQKRSDLLVMPKLVTAALGIIAIAIGARYYGLFGVVVAVTAANALYLGAVLWTRCPPRAQP